MSNTIALNGLKLIFTTVSLSHANQAFLFRFCDGI